MALGIKRQAVKSTGSHQDQDASRGLEMEQTESLDRKGQAEKIGESEPEVSEAEGQQVQRQVTFEEDSLHSRGDGLKEGEQHGSQEETQAPPTDEQESSELAVKDNSAHKMPAPASPMHGTGERPEESSTVSAAQLQRYLQGLRRASYDDRIPIWQNDRALLEAVADGGVLSEAAEERVRGFEAERKARDRTE